MFECAGLKLTESSRVGYPAVRRNHHCRVKTRRTTKQLMSYRHPYDDEDTILK